MKKLVVTLILGIMFTMGVYAEEQRIILEAGLGAMYDSGIYKENKTKNRVEPIPLINVRYGMFAIEYDRAKCYINDDFALVVGMGTGGYDNIKGMNDRAMTITAGVDYKIKLLGELSTRIKVNENFFGSKNGISAELTLEKEMMPTENDMGVLAIGTKFIDDNISNYYYGVKSNEATAERKTYKAGASFVPTIGIDYMRIITPNIYLLVSSRGELYLKEVTDSPIVDKNFNFNTLVGVCYKFM